MQSRLVSGIALCILVLGSTFAIATIQSAHGPLPSATGAPAIGGKPAEFNCTLCHEGDVNQPGGSVTILGVPAVYTPGQIYSIRVRLASNQTAGSPNRKWGFELTAVRETDGEGAGTFAVADPETLQIEGGGGSFSSRSYVEHAFFGTRTGLAGPVEWSFEWQAPPTAEGTIRFFCAANAADGTFDPSNDNIYTTSGSSFAPGTVSVPGPIASGITLAPPHPNPSKSAVTLGYSLAGRSRIELSIFDPRGRRVRRLLSGWREAGPGQVVWDGRGEDGMEVPNGAYFASMTLDDGSDRITRKVAIAR